MATPPLPRHNSKETTMASWIITATIDNLPDDTTKLAEQLVDTLTACVATSSPGRLQLQFAVDDTTDEVRPSVIEPALALLPHGGRVTEFHIRTEELLDEELARDVIPSLVGISEVADILHVSRQRAHAIMAKSPAFPRPVAELAAGPVFLEAAVRAFGERPRRAGRPAGQPLAHTS